MKITKKFNVCLITDPPEDQWWPGCGRDPPRLRPLHESRVGRDDRVLQDRGEEADRYGRRPR